MSAVPEYLDLETTKRLEALKYASNLLCSGKFPSVKSATEVTSIADAYYVFINGGNPKFVPEPTSRIKGPEGTQFLFDTKTVEIIRSDQPICRIPLNDFKEFMDALQSPPF